MGLVLAATEANVAQQWQQDQEQPRLPRRPSENMAADDVGHQDWDSNERPSWPQIRQGVDGATRPTHISNHLLKDSEKADQLGDLDIANCASVHPSLSARTAP